MLHLNHKINFHKFHEILGNFFRLKIINCKVLVKFSFIIFHVHILNLTLILHTLSCLLSIKINCSRYSFICRAYWYKHRLIGRSWRTRLCLLLLLPRFSPWILAYRPMIKISVVSTLRKTILISWDHFLPHHMALFLLLLGCKVNRQIKGQ